VPLNTKFKIEYIAQSMSSLTIQRQSIISTIIIFAGFGFGALNLLVLQKWLLTTEQWGLTRVITEAAVLLANFATLATPAVTAKFMPFYRRYLPAEKNDLPFITTVIYICGLAITILLMLVFQPALIKVFGRNNELFEPYYFALLLFVCFQSVFVFMEMHAWFAGKTILSNLLKELLFRLLTTVCLLLIAFKVVAFDGFMKLFACIYLPAAIIIVWQVRSSGTFPIYTKISVVTRRLKSKMITLGRFVFFTSLSNIAFVVCDTLFLASMYNFSQAGIYAIAQYFSQVLEVPMRSVQASSVPLISEYWRAKNKSGLASIYKKSCINLLVAGMGLGGIILVNLRNLELYFGPEYDIMIAPLAILVVSRWINLGTGLNTVIIQLSSYWRFDFASTLIYSIIGIPLNFFLIRSYGMMGAAIANVIAMFLYNALRFVFIWKKFGLQPFGWKNGLLLLSGSLLIFLIYLVPFLGNLYIDGIIRSMLFVLLFGLLIIRGNFSDEVNWLWQKWSRKILKLK
jgi:O-antigen/teichoic acid export membrane protein